MSKKVKFKNSCITIYKTTDYLHMKGVLDSIELQMLRKITIWEHNILEGETHVQRYVASSVWVDSGQAE